VFVAISKVESCWWFVRDTLVFYRKLLKYLSLQLLFVILITNNFDFSYNVKQTQDLSKDLR